MNISKETLEMLEPIAFTIDCISVDSHFDIDNLKTIFDESGIDTDEERFNHFLAILIILNKEMNSGALVANGEEYQRYLTILQNIFFGDIVFSIIDMM